MNLTAKSILLTVVTILATALSTTGIPHTVIGWEIIGITTLGTLLGYIAQSLSLPSTSVFGDLNKNDFFKGALVTLSNFLASLAASWATTTTVNWLDTLSGAGMVLLVYAIKQLATKPTGIPPTK